VDGMAVLELRLHYRDFWHPPRLVAYLHTVCRAKLGRLYSPTTDQTMPLQTGREFREMLSDKSAFNNSLAIAISV
jgi:hypothetical protein